MATVYQLRNKWRADWTDKGVRRRLRFDTKEEAENHLVMIGAQLTDPLSRFKAKYAVDLDSGCWNWRSRNGYTHFRGYRSKITHGYRFAYETFIGPIPADKELDHLCRNPKCVNPAHLEPVEPQINMQRGLIPLRQAQQRHGSITHCPVGHEYSPENRRDRGQRHKLRVCEVCKMFLDQTAKAQLGTTLAQMEVNDTVTS
jgi:hypothetical protein